MRKDIQNFACYGQLKYTVIAKTYLLGLAMARGHGIDKKRQKQDFMDYKIEQEVRN